MHYVEKLNRNVNVFDKCPENIRGEVLNNINWARELIQRLEQLDYDVREEAIQKIHEVLDSDYEKMGYSLDSNEITR